MPVPEHFQRALSQEFVCYYEVSELPETWEDWITNLEVRAAASAARMKFWLKETSSSELAAYLRAESPRRYSGELVQAIENWTRFGWSDRDEDWRVLQRILNAIADHLDRS